MELKEIKELVRFLDKSDVMEFEYEKEDLRIYVSKQQDTAVYQTAPQAVPQPVSAAPAAAPAPQAEAAAPTADAEAPASGTPVTSPIVGTFYEAPAPDAAPFCKAGDVVKKGQTLCIVEAMKIMNEIEAEFDCKIVKVEGVNGKPVEYGETLFIVEPA